MEIAPGTILLGADTTVVGPGRTLGKPRDAEDALNMLALLRGNPHYVVTGFVLLRATSGDPFILHHEAVISTVFMHDYSDFQLEGYVATGEPFDKAGAYALQGQGGQLVSHVRNVSTMLSDCLCARFGVPWLPLGTGEAISLRWLLRTLHTGDLTWVTAPAH